MFFSSNTFIVNDSHSPYRTVPVMSRPALRLELDSNIHILVFSRSDKGCFCTFLGNSSWARVIGVVLAEGTSGSQPLVCVARCVLVGRVTGSRRLCKCKQVGTLKG